MPIALGAISVSIIIRVCYNTLRVPSRTKNAPSTVTAEVLDINTMTADEIELENNAAYGSTVYKGPRY